MKLTAYLFLKLNLIKAGQPTRRIFVVGKACITSLLFATSVFAVFLQTAVKAQITPATNDADTVVNQNGNTLNIEGGTKAGANLLHSFEKFGVNQGQTANFISNPEIQNILGRVTGGDASVINGRIQVTGGNSNLYLMNPAGIIFGSGAWLNVPASFTATTANGIGLGDKWFNALGTNDYANLVGTPSQFGFTTSQPGAIVNDGSLYVEDEKNLTLVGGTILSTGQLSSRGQLVVATVPGERVVRISQPGQILSLEVQPLSASPNLPANWSLPILSLPQLLTGGNFINATDVTVSGNQVTLTGAGIQIQNGDVVANDVSAENATLSSSNNLISIGKYYSQSLYTFGDFNLLAENTVKLRDVSGFDDFSLGARGNLTIKGNQGIDIQLNNDHSRIDTGGNLNLISDGTIIGNARFITSGNVSVLNLSGIPGNFTSNFLNPNTIISSNDDTGTAVNQVGNNFTITGATQAGANLFHSFEKFGLDKGQIANFVSNPSIENILARVTGGDTSVINGTIRVTGSNSNLYLMNPAGIVFGSGASLNVPAAFTATTANGIGFGDKWFNAVSTNDYASLVGSPSQFAFTMSQPGAIINDSGLAVGAGKNLTLVGGTILSAAGLSALEGQLVVATVPGQRVVQMSQPGQILSFKVQPLSASANLPADWSLPISSLPQLLTSRNIKSASSVTINSDKVTLTGSGIQIENGDVVAKSVSAQNATLSSSQNLILVTNGEDLSIDGDLNLLAQNRVKFQDTSASGLGWQSNFNTFSTPIRVGDNLKIQGNQGIDIQFNDEHSILYTGGNINLISDSIITSNARFIAGGNFSVIDLSGGLGTFTSNLIGSGKTNLQGIISSNGDVNFGNYEGSSLKVEARGSIIGKNITITQPNTSLVGVDPDINILKSIPSLILRAGVSQLHNPPSTPQGSLGGTTFEFTEMPTSRGNITVGNITTHGVTMGSEGNFISGPVILSATGNVKTGNISTDSYNYGYGLSLAGLVALRAGGNIEVSTISTSGVRGGDITINAGGLFRATETFNESQNLRYTSDYVLEAGGKVIGLIPTSISARGAMGNSGLGRGGKINVQYGKGSFIAGPKFERDTQGQLVFRDFQGNQLPYTVDDTRRVRDEKGSPIYGRSNYVIGSQPITKENAPADASFTAGAIMSNDSNTYSVTSLQDTNLSTTDFKTFTTVSDRIKITFSPSPPTKTVTDSNTSNSNTSNTNTSNSNTSNSNTSNSNTSNSNTSNSLQTDNSNNSANQQFDNSSHEAQTAQRQLTKPSENSACPPANKILTLVRRQNQTRRETTNPPTSTTVNSCGVVSNDTSILQILRENQTKPIPVNLKPVTKPKTGN
jgi:filamentous hemagglutinin family protein